MVLLRVSGCAEEGPVFLSSRSVIGLHGTVLFFPLPSTPAIPSANGKIHIVKMAEMWMGLRMWRRDKGSAPSEATDAGCRVK